MKCPVCRHGLRGIAPLGQEEFMCVNDDCPLEGKEVYGPTQRKVTEFVKEMHPDAYRDRKKYWDDY